jgi:hypothetical protein
MLLTAPFAMLIVVEPYSAEDHDRRAGGEPRRKRMDDGGVADHLERDRPRGASDVVVAHGVLIPLNGREHQMIDRPRNLGEPAGNFLRLREVEGQSAMAIAKLGGGRLGTRELAPGDDKLLAARSQSACDFAADSRRSAYNKGAHLGRHGGLNDSWTSRNYCRNRKPRARRPTRGISLRLRSRERILSATHRPWP